jgi:hypothetical protein
MIYAKNFLSGKPNKGSQVIAAENTTFSWTIFQWQNTRAAIFAMVQFVFKSSTKKKVQKIL